MAIDHPDGIRAISVSRADIKAPVDIQKQTINVEIDIVAQALAKLQINIASSSITLNINIAAAAAGVTLNVNLKSQTANIAVNLAASAITLDIKIKAQEAGLNLNVNINAAAAAVTLNVNVKSQTANINVNVAASAATVTVSVTGTANISITAQTVAVYSKPDWEVKEGNQKQLGAEYVIAMAFGDAYYIVNYVVPAGKALYVYSASFSIRADAATDADLPQIGTCTVFKQTSQLCYIGGNGGGSYTFGCPTKVPAGEYIKAYITAYANHDVKMCASVWGIEVDV